MVVRKFGNRDRKVTILRQEDPLGVVCKKINIAKTRDFFGKI